jgi:hypothetical protein
MFKFIVTIFLFYSEINQSLAKNSDDFLSQNKSDLTQIENYLNNIKSLNANFIQQANGGEVSNGKFFLSRPGKMRVEYEKTTPVLIIANGNVLAYTDLELEETSYLSTNSTPASFLTRKIFSFSAKDVEVTNFEKSANLIKVGIVKKNKKEAGVFSLIFVASPLKFVKMEVKNDLEEITKITFTTMRLDELIDDKMFAIKNKNLPD